MEELNRLERQIAALRVRVTGVAGLGTIGFQIEAVRHIRSFVAQSYGLTDAELVETTRRENRVWARFIGFWLCRELTTHSLQGISTEFGRGDHGSVMNGIQRVVERRSVESGFNALTNGFYQQVGRELESLKIKLAA